MIGYTTNSSYILLLESYYLPKRSLKSMVGQDSKFKKRVKYSGYL